MDISATGIIQELRSLNGFGLLSDNHCVRCERYVRKHFRDMDLSETERDVAAIAEQVIEEV